MKSRSETLPMHNMPPAMILCGGQGTRIRDVTESLPKPMVPIGSRPIAWHIMKTYAAFGVRRFILCLGYKREAFVDYFLNYRARNSDITVALGPNGHVIYHKGHEEENWEVTLADTGEHTMTGGRVWQASKYLRPEDENCFLTYGDGLANIDVHALYAHHLKEQKALTVTAVHPASRFGEMKLRGGRVASFQEKPQTDVGLINGGYMVFQRRFVQEFLSSDTTLVLEKQPMQSVVAAKEMAAYTHEGFWQCMDTLREHQQLNQMWDRGEAPWTEAWQCTETLSMVGKSSSRGTQGSKARGSRRGFAA
jgi:glucose-1-phosphate cytidylyltransferase